MKIYAGNRGLVEHVPEEMPRFAERRGYVEHLSENIPRSIMTDKKDEPGSAPKKKVPGLTEILGGLGSLGTKLTDAFMDADEVLLLVFLYLLYRESKDVEFLLIAGAMLIL